MANYQTYKMSTIMDAYRDIAWSSEQLTMREFIDRYRENLPQIIMVTQGFYGNSEVETFAADQILRIHTISTQRRVIATDSRGRYLSIPCDFPLKFEVLNDQGKPVGKSRFFRDIVECCRMPVKVRFAPEMAGIDFQIDSTTKSTDSFGVFEVREFFTEKYFKANTINGSVIHSKIIVIPLYVNISICVATGMANGDLDLWHNLQAAYTRALKGIDFSQVEGNIDITMYEDREFQRGAVKGRGDDKLYDYIEPRHYVKLNYKQTGPDTDKGYTLISPPENVVRHIQRSKRPQNNVEIPVNVYESVEEIEARERKEAEDEEPPPELPEQRHHRKPPPIPTSDGGQKSPTKTAESSTEKTEVKKGLAAELAAILAGGLKPTKNKPLVSPKPAQKPSTPPVSKQSSVSTVEETNPRYGPTPTREDRVYEELSEGPPYVNDIPRGTVKPFQPPVSNSTPPVVDLPTKPPVVELKRSDSQPFKDESSSDPVYQSFAEIPHDVTSLSIDEVASCLKVLKMDQYIPAFRDNDIDGTLLAALEEDILQDEFDMKPFHARKLMQFVRGWRPQ
ncbi:uncharacterized protein LOC106173774 [Lingula anatina]|uniref:Uncharacterized protein LOC106173774 n=1 Tax=Lingula anatina TaxID=7574 RepID=A0A2R2MRN3_LINAN|nr:uncharacterized protein LOC106173774 [Lingula anatina]|eukprot:XP_023932915.1 uncharacterized protein LOC106173774 [Lingula anatina]